ncbi:MAG: ECF transporter S component [Ruminococcus sp.]|nr:ECF transporter S component [Ruminococcus sp.]
MKATYKLVLSAMFLAVGIVLPFFTGQIPQIGNLLLPMHFTIFLCTFICGWQYGTAVGFMLPLLRSFMFGAPILYPDAIAMSLELCVYGLVAGLIYQIIRHKNILAVYTAMLIAMISGRVVWGIAQLILLGVKSEPFTLQMFISAAFVNALPGILLQLIFIPAVISILDWKFQKAERL